MHAIKQFFGHSVLYGLGTVAGSLVTFLLLPVYTRVLSPSEYGNLEALLALYQILLPLSAFGVASSIFGCYFLKSETEEQRQQVISTAVWAVLVWASLFGALSWLSAPLWAARIVPGISLDLVRLTIMAAAAGAMGLIPLAVMRAKQLPIRYVSLALGQVVATLGLNVLQVVGMGLGIRGVLQSMLIVQGLTAVATLIVVGKTLGFTVSRYYAGLMLRWGGLHVPNSIATWVTQLADRYLLLWFTTSAQVGIYALGYKLGMIVQIALVTPFSIAWPGFMYTIAKREDANYLYGRILTWLIAATTGLGLLLALFRHEILGILAPGSYGQAAMVVPWILLAAALGVIPPMMMTGLNITAKFGYGPLFSGAGALTNIGLNLVLIPRYGAIGAAWATVASYAVVAAFSWAIAHRFRPIPYEWPRVGAVLGMGILLFLIGEVWSAHPWAIAAKAGMLGLYLIGLGAVGVLPKAFLPRTRAILKAALARQQGM